MKEYTRDAHGFFQNHMTPVVLRTFYVLIVTFLVTLLLLRWGPAIGLGSLPEKILLLTPNDVVEHAAIWQLFTYAFTASGLFAFLFALLGLFFFGPLVENGLGSRRFFWFMVLSALGVAILYIPIALAFGAGAFPLAGFAGVEWAILFAAVFLFPRTEVLLFFFPVPMYVLGFIFGFILLVSFVTAPNSPMVLAVGLGGAGLAFLMVRFPVILDFFAGFQIGRRRRRRRKGGASVISMGHPGRHSDPDDLYDDPHWKLDQ